jgi:Ser/Thr protein kinase RdoA (MazF antagonist)
MASSSLGVLEAKAPSFSTFDAERLAAEVFGVTGVARPLESERDQNFGLEVDGDSAFVLKIANPAEPPEIVDFQTRAFLHVARCDPGLAVPRVHTLLVGVDGPHENVLKIRPPMVFSERDAETLLSALDRSLDPM